MTPPADWIVPQWGAPANVRALFTTRTGGLPSGPFDGGGGMNLGSGDGGDARAVAANRAALAAQLPAAPRWLRQVHGVTVVEGAKIPDPAAGALVGAVEADGAWTTTAGVVLAVLVADCMPVLLADADGRGVAVAHAGWRGLAGGIIQRTVQALRGALGDADAELVAWLGPCIGPRHFEVGDEVRTAMLADLPDAARAFSAHGPGKWLADLPQLGRQALAQQGVVRVHGGRWCTVEASTHFYSYRRERITGRHAALAWFGAQ